MNEEKGSLSILLGQLCIYMTKHHTPQPLQTTQAKHECEDENQQQLQNAGWTRKRLLRTKKKKSTNLNGNDNAAIPELGKLKQKDNEFQSTLDKTRLCGGCVGREEGGGEEERGGKRGLEDRGRYLLMHKQKRWPGKAPE